MIRDTYANSALCRGKAWARDVIEERENLNRQSEHPTRLGLEKNEMRTAVAP